MLDEEVPNIMGQAGRTYPRWPADQRNRHKYVQRPVIIHRLGEDAAGSTEATAHLDEDGVIFDVVARLQDALSHEQRAAGGDVHLGRGASEAAAVRIGLEGVAQVLPGRSLVHQHQSHLAHTHTHTH